MFDRIMPRNRLLIMALLTSLAASFAGGATCGFCPKDNVVNTHVTKKEIKEYNKGRDVRDLAKKGKTGTQGKLNWKGKSYESNKNQAALIIGPEKQRKDLARKQKQERKKLKQNKKKSVVKRVFAVVNIPQLRLRPYS